ncbi:MAG: glycine/betaine ABC transporter substrate-binding protein [Dehalococcoidia bacterium]|nr:glycine/betaine ABC transporter substrate-binding protein [Dehalococcoidia bacterium]
MHKNRPIRIFGLVAAVVLAPFLLIACGDDDDDDGSDTTPSADAAPLEGVSFAVGSKEFTEQLVLEIAIKALEHAGASVEDKTSIFSTANVRAALDSGDIDMYWEYTGTGWSVILQREISEAPADTQELYQAVADADLEESQVVWLDAAEANNTYALATLSSRAEELGVTTISEFAELASSNPEAATLCGATEWLTRDDGYPGLAAAYGFDLPDNAIAEVELAIIPSQVVSGDTCNFGEAFATDGAIAANDLVVLEDDEGYFVAYNLALTINQDAYEGNEEEIDAIFDPITEKLTNEVLQEMNAKVDVDGEQPEDVAEQFLQDNGFLD